MESGTRGLPWWLSGNEPACSAVTLVQSLGGSEDPLEEEMAPTPIFLPGKPRGQRSLVGHSPWGRKESDTTEQLQFSVT